jgi:hypothetical protein
MQYIGLTLTLHGVIDPPPKIQTYVAKFFTVPHTGEVAFLGPLGGGSMNCLYRDVRMPRRRALGLALCQPVKHVVVTLRCGCAPSAAAGFKNYSAVTLYAKMFWHKVWAWG